MQNEVKLNWQFTNCIKKCDFLQTNPNKGILYIVGNHFLPRLKIRDHYLKIRLRLAWINCQSFANLYKNACRRSEHFRREWSIPLWKGGQRELFYTLRRWWGWLETMFCCGSTLAAPRAFHRCHWQHFSCWETAFPLINVLWLAPASACASVHYRCCGLRRCHELEPWERKREKELLVERESTRGREKVRGTRERERERLLARGRWRH